MILIQTSNGFLQEGWAFFVTSILILAALFFIQKYVYLFDKKLNDIRNTDSAWKAKPWLLYFGLVLGCFVSLYNTFSPKELSSDVETYDLPKLIFIVLIVAGIIGIAYESITHYGVKYGVIRSLIYILLAVGYYYAGFITGLFFVSIIALVLLVFVFKYFKKLFT